MFVNSTTTSTYQYNHHNQRTKLVEGSDTTLYPFSSYHIENGTPKLYLPLGTVPVATMQGTTTAYLHTNHLTSTNVVTDSSGEVVQTLDYYPYGSERLNFGADTTDRHYIGEYHDKGTDLSYFNARYYSGQKGQFLSQDPIFNAIGNNTEILEKTSISTTLLLSDPQQLNSYSYARNNPISYKDPTGNLTWSALWNEPISSLLNSAGWGVTSFGVNAINRPLTAKLLRHSASLSPGDVRIDSGNQKQYGNIVNSIKVTSQYKNFVDQAIENAKNGQNITSGSVQFDTGDLYTSLHKANIDVSVNETESGWNISAIITDRYDFNETNPQTYKGTITRIPATRAYKDQQKGVLSNYNIRIEISDELNNYNE